MEMKVLVFVEVAAGIILGLVVWSYVGPMLTSVTPAPSA
jgi:hypothetical protein